MIKMEPTLTLTIEDPRSPAGMQLMSAMEAEINEIYDDDEGFTSLVPDGVLGPGGAFVIAWLDDQPVGCGALRPVEEPGVGEIKRMYVDPTVRGRRIAERILEKLEAEARAFGYHMLILETGEPQHFAIRLYERMGYERIASYGEYHDDPRTVCFGKRL